MEFTHADMHVLCHQWIKIPYLLHVCMQVTISGHMHPNDSTLSTCACYSLWSQQQQISCCANMPLDSVCTLTAYDQIMTNMSCRQLRHGTATFVLRNDFPSTAVPLPLKLMHASVSSPPLPISQSPPTSSPCAPLRCSSIHTSLDSSVATVPPLSSKHLQSNTQYDASTHLLAIYICTGLTQAFPLIRPACITFTHFYLLRVIHTLLYSSSSCLRVGITRLVFLPPERVMSAGDPRLRLTFRQIGFVRNGENWTTLFCWEGYAKRKETKKELGRLSPNWIDPSTYTSL